MSSGSVRDQLERRIRDRDAVVGVVGLGYVGLPLALAFAEAGFPVIGFDVDPTKTEALTRGDSYIQHLDSGRLRAIRQGDRFTATTDFSRLGEADAILICVPTPLTTHREPDLSFVEATAEATLETLRRGQLVVLESTTYPGTTQDLLAPLFERSGLTCGEDFFLAYSPEREDPGRLDIQTTDIPKVIGGNDSASTALADALYSIAFSRTVPVSSARVAEAVKLTENVFRAVNIALVNELKVIYQEMGVDVWEVLDAAETKPFGFMRFNPGPGWGGHCIPLDPFYLSWKAREYGISARFIELAGEVNRQMPEYVVQRLQNALNDRTKSLKDSRILVLGIAYKPDVADPRESPAFEIIEKLLHRGSQVDYHDPLIPEAPPMRTWPDLPPLRSVELSNQRLASSDAVVIVTDHSSLDYQRVARLAPLVVDTRGALRRPQDNVVKA